MYPQDKAAMTVGEPEPMRWVNENVERLARNAEEVEKGLDALIARLDPITSPSPPTLASDAKTGERLPISALAEKLDNIANGLAHIAGRQARLLARLEI